MGLALLLHQDAAETTGRDADGHERLVADQVPDRERFGGLRSSEQAEEQERDAHAGEAEAGPDDGSLAAVDVDHLGGEEAAHPEHRNEGEQQRHQRDAADVEVDDRAQDVVDEDGDQQESTADQRADDEDEIFDRDVDHRSSSPPP